MAVVKTTKEIVWLKKIIEDLQEKQVNSTPLLVDNTSAIKLRRISYSMIKLSTPTKKYYLILYHVQTKTIHSRHCFTNELIANIFIKTWRFLFWKVHNDAWTHKHPFKLRGGDVRYLILRDWGTLWILL